MEDWSTADYPVQLIGVGKSAHMSYLGNWIDPRFPSKPFGVHAGLWGLIVNIIVIYFYAKYQLSLKKENQLKNI